MDAENNRQMVVEVVENVVVVLACGVGIEVDGGFHDREDKMILDLVKMDIASCLGIYFQSIRNEQIEGGRFKAPDLFFQTFISDFHKFKKLSSRERREKYANLILFNVFYHESEFFCKKLNISSSLLDEMAHLGFTRMSMKYSSKSELRKRGAKSVKLIF